MIAKERLYTIVRDQLAEFDLLNGLVPREVSARVSGFRGDTALVVKGIRRCGKSTLLKQVMKTRFRDDFFYFNFDDERVVGFEADDFQKLMEAFMELFGKHRALLLDEIQNIAGWELFINRMLREGFSVFITGSNAELLSEELGTRLTGRHTDIELFPFSFREFLESRKIQIDPGKGYSTGAAAVLARQFKDYLALGGMPEAVVGKNPAVLSHVLEDIIQKDIVRRYRIRKPNELREVLYFLISNVSNRITFRSISDNFRLKSSKTVQKYFQYAEKAYLLFTVNRFERKIKLLEKSPKKIYCMDNGIVVRNAVGLGENRGALLANLAAVELRRAGLPLYYYVTKSGFETDFITVNPKTKKPVLAVQVCADPENIATRRREEKALVQTLRELGLRQGTIVTMDFEETKKIEKKTIQYTPAWKWLLEKPRKSAI